jgi:hypothetical protein
MLSASAHVCSALIPVVKISDFIYLSRANIKDEIINNCIFVLAFDDFLKVLTFKNTQL